LATGDTFAYGINDAGQIVGEYSDASGSHGFLLSAGKYTTLDDPSAGGPLSSTVAWGINNKGQIVGSYRDSANHEHGFLYSGGFYITLDDPLATQGTGVVGCCARTANGHVAAALPSSMMNSRRLTRLPRQRAQAG
jgi:probable HAF family extracellular repeat protein